jgi:hypothetical protein
MSEFEPIAERVLFAVDKNGREFDIGLKIGIPYKIEGQHDEWACPVALVGLHRGFPDMRGIDSLQALSLALRLSRILLEAFIESDGGRIYFEKGGPELTVDEAFGVSFQLPSEEADEELSDEQQKRVSLLTAEEIATLDAAILRNCSTQFRKIARVVGSSLGELQEIIPNVPDLFYAQRIRQLIADGKLESQGNITAMRFGEIKLP